MHSPTVDHDIHNRHAPRAGFSSVMYPNPLDKESYDLQQRRLEMFRGTPAKPLAFGGEQVSRANYAAVNSAWATWLLTLLAAIILGWVVFLVVNWQYAYYEHCAWSAAAQIKSAEEYQTTFCLAKNVTYTERTMRLVSKACIGAGNLVVEGGNIGKWNCFLSKNMAGLGNCTSFSFCRQLVHWIDEFVSHIALMLWCVLLFLAYKVMGRLRTKFVTTLSTAVDQTRSYCKSSGAQLPLTNLEPM